MEIVYKYQSSDENILGINIVLYKYKCENKYMLVVEQEVCNKKYFKNVNSNQEIATIEENMKVIGYLFYLKSTLIIKAKSGTRPENIFFIN